MWSTQHILNRGEGLFGCRSYLGLILKIAKFLYQMIEMDLQMITSSREKHFLTFRTQIRVFHNSVILYWRRGFRKKIAFKKSEKTLVEFPPKGPLVQFWSQLSLTLPILSFQCVHIVFYYSCCETRWYVCWVYLGLFNFQYWPEGAKCIIVTFLVLS